MRSHNFRAPNKEARKLIKIAKMLGYTVTMTGGQHLRFEHEVSKVIVLAAGSPRVAKYSRTYHELLKRLPPDDPIRKNPPRYS